MQQVGVDLGQVEARCLIDADLHGRRDESGFSERSRRGREDHALRRRRRLRSDRDHHASIAPSTARLAGAVGAVLRPKVRQPQVASSPNLRSVPEFAPAEPPDPGSGFRPPSLSRGPASESGLVGIGDPSQ
jgi:hypothetical protein